MRVGIRGDLGGRFRRREAGRRVRPAPGPRVEKIIGGADDIRIVLYDKDCVAEIAELFHDADELGGIAGVQADGWFVEHVESANQAGSQGLVAS